MDRLAAGTGTLNERTRKQKDLAAQATGGTGSVTRMDKKVVVRILSSVHRLLTEQGMETMDQLALLRSDIIRESAEWTTGMGRAKVLRIENRVLDSLEETRDIEAQSDDETDEETNG